MAHSRRDRSRAARRRLEKQKANEATRERGAEAVATAEDARSRPRNARHAAQIDVLLHRHVITIDQARAGHRFARDFHLSGTVIGRLIGRYEAGMPRPPKKYSAPPSDTPHAIEARELFELACQALGPLCPITVHVAICDLPPSEWCATADRLNGDARAVLRFALSTLARHYAGQRYALNGSATAEAAARAPEQPWSPRSSVSSAVAL
jgi:hypothetical protein